MLQVLIVPELFPGEKWQTCEKSLGTPSEGINQASDINRSPHTTVITVGVCRIHQGGACLDIVADRIFNRLRVSGCYAALDPSDLERVVD